MKSGNRSPTPKPASRQAGYEVERRSDIGPGTPDALVLVLVEPDPGVPLRLIESH